MAPVVYVSTDYVFGGDKPGAYTEDDNTDPINAYGRSKLLGELAVAQANPRHFIFRTSWLFSAHGSNFVKTMFRLANERDEISSCGRSGGQPNGSARSRKCVGEHSPKPAFRRRDARDISSDRCRNCNLV